MDRSNRSFIDGIRSSSRQIVRELGFLESNLAATPYSASAVHTILEIGARGHMTAIEIAESLYLEKSSVSRMVRKLIDAGELQEAARDDDGRVKELSLTSRGVKTYHAIEAYGRKQVSDALGRLTSEEAQAVNVGLQAYARALSRQGTSSDKAPKPGIQILNGYWPGIIGGITGMHARCFAAHPSFGQAFESHIATGLAEFLGRLSDHRNGLWVAQRDGRILGSIAVDHENTDNRSATIRWFMSDDDPRRYDIGSKLFSEAIAHCDRAGDMEIRLWAFDFPSQLDGLYAANDFKLSEMRRVTQWNKEVNERLYVRTPNPKRIN